MAQIFISYRREEGSPYARMLFDSLSRHFGAENVFYDHKAIEPGLDFQEVIQEELKACDVLIALIGDDWLTYTSADGVRRIDQSEDLVHQEIAAALRRKIRLIPVLLRGAGMPKAEQLPEALAKLANRNAIELTEAKWEYDQQRLIEILQKVLGGAPPKREAAGPFSTGTGGGAPAVEVLLKKALLCKAEADDMFADSEAPARKKMLQQAYVHLQQANELDPTNTAVLLEMARLLVELTPDDPTDEAKLLRRVKKFLGNPAGETERFHLAQATFLLATSSEPNDREAIEDARDMFKKLGKPEWVRQCNDALKTLPREPEPPSVQPNQPAPLSAVSFAGRWHVDIAAMVASTMLLELFPNGACQGSQQIPLMGSVVFQEGRWGFDAFNRVLHIQGMIQFVPFNLAIVIQGTEGTGYSGIDQQGIAYRFKRM